MALRVAQPYLLFCAHLGVRQPGKNCPLLLCFVRRYTPITGALVLGAVVGFDKGFSFPNLYIYIILNLCGESKNFFQSPRRFLITVVEVDFVVIWTRVIAEPVANSLQVVGHAQIIYNDLASIKAGG